MGEIKVPVRVGFGRLNKNEIITQILYVPQVSPKMSACFFLLTMCQALGYIRGGGVGYKYESISRAVAGRGQVLNISCHHAHLSQ